MLNLGTVKPGSTIIIPFTTYGSSGESLTMSGLATSDVKVYKGTSMTERASASGFTLLDTDGIDIDSVTGLHGLSIDLADDTTAGFWQAGSDYFVVIDSITVNTQTVRFIAARFRIGYDGAVLDTTISALTSQTVFRLTAGPADNDALNGCPIVVHDKASAVQVAIGMVLDYDGTNKEVTLAINPNVFTMAVGDNVSIMPRVDVSYIQGTVVPTSGNAQVDVVKWNGSNVATPDTAGYPKVTLKSGTGTGEISLTSGTVTAAVASVANNAITAASLASDAVNEIADQVWDEAIAGHSGVGSAGKYMVDILAEAAQAGDILDLLGSATDGTIAQDIANVYTSLLAIDGRIPAALVSGRMDASVGAMANSVLTAAALASDAVQEIWTSTLTESYPTDGSAFTAAQALYMLQAEIGEFAISSTTKTNYKRDGSTTAFTQTINDATNPTGIASN